MKISQLQTISKPMKCELFYISRFSSVWNDKVLYIYIQTIKQRNKYLLYLDHYASTFDKIKFSEIISSKFVTPDTITCYLKFKICIKKLTFKACNKTLIKFN